MPTIQQVLETALQQHQAGNLQQAEQLYCQILQVQPDQVDALHLLGLVYQRSGRHQQAVDYISRALQLKPDFAEAYSNLGIVLRQMGRLEEAVASYRQALRWKPDNAQAINNLGVALRESKRLDEAIACYRQALQLSPRYAEAYNNLGIALADQGKLDEAITAYRQALALKPNHAEAYNNLGNTLRRQGKLDDAVASFREALRLRPQHADTHYNLGVALGEQEKHEESVASYRQALRCKPDHVEAHNNLGVALTDQRQLDEAVALLQRAIRLRAEYPEGHNNLGNALKEMGRIPEALACFQEALRQKPDFAVAYINTGAAYMEQGKPDEAVACYQQALELRPDYAEAHSNLGTALLELGQVDQAVARCQEALRLKPDNPEALTNLGAALREKGMLDEATSCYHQALRIKPNYPEALNNLGIALTEQGKLEEAVACYQQALRLNPNNPEALNNLGLALASQGDFRQAVNNFDQALQPAATSSWKPKSQSFQALAHMNRAMAWLLMGDFERGWPEYEWRWQCKDQQERSFRQPRWDGSALQGRTILLHAEQGLGDTIQFARYARLVKERGGRVIVESPRALLSLLSSCAGIDELVAVGSPLPAFDCHAPLLSLAAILHTRLDTIPTEVPYLFAEEPLCERWRQELASMEGLKVGIVWQGNPKHKGDRWRSLPLEQWGELARVANVRLISLQKGHGAEQLAALGGKFEVIDLGPRFQEESWTFMDTAAVLANLDLLVSVDTSVAHLAGALGRTVWVLMPAAPDWRWMLERGDSPWYPTMRLFRQARRGDWSDVRARVAEALQHYRDGGPADTHSAPRIPERRVTPAVISAPPPAVADPAGKELDSGVALAQKGKLEEALARFEEALRLRPHYAEAMYNIGIVRAQQDNLDGAVSSYRRALTCKPDYTPALVNLGVVLAKQKKKEEAVRCYREALRLQPESVEAHINLGTALIDQNRLDEASTCLGQALRLAPDRPETHYNLGVLLSNQARHAESVASMQRALTLRRDYPDAQINLANAFLDLGRLDEAAVTLQELLQAHPDNADAHKNLSMVLLVQGDLERGWREYEWRWRTSELPPRSFAQPLWDGAPLQGRTILLHAEQGLGDTIQFARYARLVKERGGRVMLECQPALASLLATCPGVDEIVTRGSSLPVFDVHAPLLGLPGIFRTTLSTIPNAVPYLAASQSQVERWREEFHSLSGLKVGIVWQGNPGHKGDRWRSVPLAQFLPLAQLPGVRLLSLQMGHGTEQLGALGDKFEVLDLGSRLQKAGASFQDTAALLMNLDLLVTVDTAPAHLAGALGRPVWLALPFSPDWRWLRDREDSPWYPTMRLFRQQTHGDWPEVFERIAMACRLRLGMAEAF